MDVVLREQFDFTELIRGQKVIAASVGAKGDAILLTTGFPESTGVFARIKSHVGAIFPRTTAEAGYLGRAIRIRDGSAMVTPIELLTATFPHVQPLNDAAILVVSARCDARSATPEQNAALYNVAGRLLRRMVFGDGIQDVQVDRQGNVWVSYFDEGVFGNFGWEEPIGAPGLLRFDESGKITWAFSPPIGCNTIADCYALNVADEATWICYYYDFPLVRIAVDGSAVAWKDAVTGASALAVTDESVLFFGGYGSDRLRLALQRFQRDRLASPIDLQIDPSQREVLAHARVIGRGAILHAFSENKWWQLDLRNL
jgi:hypothetical protein